MPGTERGMWHRSFRECLAQTVLIPDGLYESAGWSDLLKSLALAGGYSRLRRIPGDRVQQLGYVYEGGVKYPSSLLITVPQLHLTSGAFRPPDTLSTSIDREQTGQVMVIQFSGESGVFGVRFKKPMLRSLSFFQTAQ